MKIGIIPARYASTRFPGKPLTLFHNKPLLQHVYERAKEADLDDLFVATDDERIMKTVEDFGGKAIMTHPLNASGTDRCAEAAQKLHLRDTDLIINIQGDEPFIQKEEINMLIHLFENPEIQIATIAKPTTANKDMENPDKVKVVFSKSNKALYFSRSPIPHSTHPQSHIHTGIYAFRNDILQQRQ